MSAGHVGISEISEVCTRMRAINLDLFTELGRWVRAEAAGPTQRWYATACHRHATHASWWAERTPVIAGADTEADVAGHRASRLPGAPDAIGYRGALEELSAELGELAERIDPDLDPSTSRVISLVTRDLDELLAI